MSNPLLYVDTDFTTSGGSVDPEQLRQEFSAASFPSTPVSFVAIDTAGVGATLLVKVHFDTDPDAADEVNSDSLIATHTATGATPIPDENGGLGYTLQWGGNLQNTGRYGQVSGITSGGEETGLSPGSEIQALADGTLDCFSYSSGTGNNTTVYKIWKNGAVAHTFTAKGATDFEENIGLAVLRGDLIAIEYDAGMRPAGCYLEAYIN